jgi:RNA polymerase sigma-70 factor (ECF subfamily)
MASTEGCSLALSFIEDAPSAVDLPALVDTYSTLLFRIANSVLRSRTEAEDVVQDVFIRVLEHRLSLPTVRDMRVWLIRIAWNLALDRKRRKRPDQLDEMFAQTLASATMPADTAMEEAQRFRSVLREIERLPKAERHVLLLSAIEELGTAEIAAVLRRSESAVRALLSRARARLRERLDDRPRLKEGGKAR